VFPADWEDREAAGARFVSRESTDIGCCRVDTLGNNNPATAQILGNHGSAYLLRWRAYFQGTAQALT
jgi:hypothetical protein